MASDFLYQAKGLLRQHRVGSQATQAARLKTMTLIDRQLREAGVKRLQLRNLKPKHIERVLSLWKEQGLSAGTIKNRMAHIRWVSERIGKSGLCAASNASMGIEQRQYVTNEQKAVQLDFGALERISEPHLRMSFRLQEAFGLRREEAMKIQPMQADKGTHLHLHKTKGARPRDVAIRTEVQRKLLDEAKALARSGSLIPSERTYKQQMKLYEREAIKLGAGFKGHGLRHAYAQQRYLELTGRLAPAAGGESTKGLSGEAKTLDFEARMQISNELGHGRESVTAVYLGR
ncbi:integrase domain-containing protein [Neiella sp. HB171785]|uniref:Integrase domain-containing protein n=1 Tax=Neiella litorisoli TaxID=2771431 RepID=A0A8J6UK72_9GAMM|nr:phage integrase N-terminal domain-containing protein [Neiella litorisoli]MBD1391458.1 integrase domain-containing protein [Neiella litorisoli]